MLSVHIVALGSECPGGVGPGDETTGPGQIQGGLLWSYLGHGARELDPNSVTPSRHPLNPAFMEYQSRVFGDVRVMVRDCPSWMRLAVSVLHLFRVHLRYFSPLRSFKEK
uniref:Uncharacterized protein n=1 Tax=Sinocyclocheilus grahami TaxID=75366 RepID=A0A672M428_SINGR